jgi:glycosyltransferase involved in cell wall biosynthesis
MASSVPVVAARTGGIPGIIKDNETGLLVDSQDVDALTTQVESLVDDLAKRRRLAAAACEFVTLNHSFKRMCAAYQRLYREVMDDG